MKKINVNGIINITPGYNESGLRCLWVDSNDSFTGIHSKGEYRSFKRKLLKALKKLDKIEKELGKT